MSPVFPATQILLDCDNTCCVCHHPRAEPLHVHHIDGDRSNNTITNLAVLCKGCHTDAHVKGRIGRVLSPDMVRKHRAAWIEAVRRRRQESGWKELISWAAQMGSRDAVKRVRSAPLTVSGPWRIMYGGRPSRRLHGHLRIEVFKSGEPDPFEEVVNLKDRMTAWWNREGYVIEEPGTFVLEVHADTDWWWVRVESKLN